MLGRAVLDAGRPVNVTGQVLRRGPSREAPAAAMVMDIFGEERPVRLGPLPVSIEDVARLVGSTGGVRT
jgi:hypothetical protein